MNNYYKRIDPSGILLIFFIILKLTGSIDFDGELNDLPSNMIANITAKVVNNQTRCLKEI